ncbi:MAG: hypothetical protein IPJ65_34325 [Archangiaceae bacterium]|nr:hypothetical protein [Archangiaceae bacterium]
MRRVVACLSAVLLCACPSDVKHCAIDEDCGADGQCVVGVCALKNADGGGGGGTAGCSTPCSDSTECIAGSCRARYAAIEWRAPAQGGSIYSRMPVLRAELIRVDGGHAASNPQVALSLMPGTTSPFTVSGDQLTATVSVTEGTYTAVATFADAGLQSSALYFSADFSPPVLVARLLAAPSRRVTLDLTEVDPALADLYDSGQPSLPVYRRDELARVVLTSDKLLDAGSVQLDYWAVTEDDGGSSLPHTTNGSEGVSCPPGACRGAGFCQCFDLDVSRTPQLGTFGIYRGRVSASTAASAPATAPLEPFAVTRWKWRRTLVPAVDAGYAVALAPGLDSEGNVIAWARGVSCAPPCSPWSFGDVFAVRPNGDLKWRSTSQLVSDLPLPPIVGRATAYLPQLPLAGFNLFDGGTAPPASCSPPYGYFRALSSAALGTVGTPAQEHVLQQYVLAGAGELLYLAANRHGAACQVTWLGAASSSAVLDFTSPVAGAFDGQDFWTDVHGPAFDGGDLGVGRFRARANATFTLVERQADVTSVTSQLIPIADGGAWGVTGFNGEVDAGRLFHFASGTVDAFTPSMGRLGGAVGAVALPDRAWALFSDGNAGRLAELSATASSSRPLSPVYRAPPLLGRGGLLYLLGRSEVSARRLDGGADFPLLIPGANGGLANSPNLDCTRDDLGRPVPGRPGVLYFVSSSTTVPGEVRDVQLYAIVVDSAGIDTTAPWPMALHDPRHTNNAATDLAEFRCP